MGTSVVRRAILLCDECFANIYDAKVLVKGSEDPTDLRCPECGSGTFSCGYCLKSANRFALDSDKLTWNCHDGCNP